MAICAANLDASGINVENGFRIGVNGGSSLQEEGRREVVDMRWWCRGREKVREDGTDPRGWAGHDR